MRPNMLRAEAQFVNKILGILLENPKNYIKFLVSDENIIWMVKLKTIDDNVTILVEDLGGKFISSNLIPLDKIYGTLISLYRSHIYAFDQNNCVVREMIEPHEETPEEAMKRQLQYGKMCMDLALGPPPTEMFI